MRFLCIITLLAFNATLLKAQITVTSSADTVGRYDLFEVTIGHPRSYPNNWEDVSVNTIFSGPDSIHISGFFYNTNTWKVRFAAPKTGIWNYTITFTTPTNTYTAKGKFTCITSGTKGFLQKHPTNPYRLIHADGTLFNGIGLGDCILDLNGNGTPHDDWGFDGDVKPKGENRPYPQYYGSTTSLENYMNAFGENGAKFNLFRWSLDNCSFGLFNSITPAGNSYRIESGMWADTMMKALRKNNIRLWTTFFGYPLFRNIDGSTPLEEAAIKRYINYVVARYGAYTDIWELFNEAFCTDYYIKTITDYIRSIDPYKRVISISAEKPENDAIDIVSPHWYHKESELESDQVTWEAIHRRKTWKKPIIFGEQGNSGQNWDPLSATRMRIRSWTSFFAEGIFIFWNASWTKEYLHPSANIYLGPEERSYIRAMQQFTEIADSAVVPATISTFNANDVRGYGLRSPKFILGYFHHYSSHSTLTETRFNYRMRKGGTIYWINPADNKIIDSARLKWGLQTITSPSFQTDIAMRISLDSADAPINVNEPLQILTYPNPVSGEFKVEGNFNATALLEVYDRVGRKVLTNKSINNNQRISVSGFTKGVYFYRVTTAEKRQATGKIIVL